MRLADRANRLNPRNQTLETLCALRPDDTDASSGISTGPPAAGSAFMLPHPVRFWTAVTFGLWTRTWWP